MSLISLPIDPLLPRIVEKLQRHAALVLQAPTGAGKTTRLPTALWESGLTAGKLVLLLQPRRIAARAAATRMASELGGQVGDLVGYQVRFEGRSSRQTRILVVTEGVLVRMLQDDPLLERVGAVIFDEFHQRSLHGDLCLAMVRRVQTEVRPDLKLVIMSATLAPEPLAQYLGDAPIVVSQGRLFPVEIEYTRDERRTSIAEQTAEAVERVLSQTPGNVLVFLPGVGEIRATAKLLGPITAAQNLAVSMLYGDLPLEEQQRALESLLQRKVVLATNVAETSLTVEGVTAVVDSGLARVLNFDPALGINRLQVTRISRAAAAQRAGRAGRTAPGICLRLWTERQQQRLSEHETPEIARVDLSGAVLELLAWGEKDVAALPWFEPPQVAPLEQALALLRMLQAIDDQGLTELGRAMVRLPVPPRIARLLVAARDLGHIQQLALVAALLSERDPFRQPPGNSRRSVDHWSKSDVLDRLGVLEQFERSGESGLGVHLDRGAARGVLRVRDQLLKLAGEAPGPRRVEQICEPEEAVLRALLAAFADRIARRRDAGGRRGVMLGGRGVRLADSSAVMSCDLFVCVDVEEIGGSESLVRLASAVERSWLPPELLTSSVDVEFDPERGRVVAVRRTRLGDLVIDEAPTSVPADRDVSELLAREALLRFDPEELVDEEARRLMARIQFLSGAMPELGWPATDNTLWAELVPELCRGCTSLAEVRKGTSRALGALRSLLDGAQLSALERHAPERLQVPSGSSIRLQYEYGRPPVLAVRIQEMFGLRATPLLAAGRVPVLLHLLGPNDRTQQITTDLASFWQNTYSEIRKDLRRRYPKHAWPEDPLAAPPQRRPTRKS